MKSARILLLAVATLCALIALCACGGGQTDSTPEHTHEFGEWDVTEKPTCIENGLKVSSCDCGEKETEVIVALGHTPGETVVEDKIDATYEAEGSYKSVIYCTTCNEKISEETHNIPMLKHTPADAVEENRIEATCYSEGSYDTVVYCSDCGAELERAKHTIPMVEHTPAAAVEENLNDSTCYAEGSKDLVVYCSVTECHKELSRNTETIIKKTHTPATAVEENRVDPTFEKAGSYQMVVYCSVAECHAELERTTHTIDMLVHHPGTAVIENEVAATCAKNGSYDEVVYCLDDNCGHKELSRKTITISMLAHTNGTAVEENRVNATCYSEGSYDSVVYCSVCNTELSRNKVTLQKIAHSPAEAIIENLVNASCMEKGKYDTVVYCGICGDEIRRTITVLDELAHILSDAETINYIPATCNTVGSYDLAVYCTKCGGEISREHFVIEMSPHTFDLSTCIACGVTAECNEGIKLTLNSDGKSYTVNSIQDCTDEIIYLTNRDGLPITALENLGDSKAKAIILGHEVSSISESLAFGNYDVMIEDANKYFKIQDCGLYTADGSKLIRFFGGEGYDSFTVDENTPELYPNAFTNNDNLVNFRILGGITFVPKLNYCDSLKEIYTEDIITDFNTELRFCPALETVIVRGSYTRIYEMAFSGCDSLKYIVIPQNVTRIDIGSFYHGRYPDIIYYEGGSLADWKSISHSTLLDDKVKYYSETKPLMPGLWWHYIEENPVLWPPIPEGEGSKGFEYQINDDLCSYTWIGYGSCTDEDVVIPSTYNDMPVTAIDLDICSAYWIKSVTMPDSITTMGSWGFQECQNLHTVRLSSKLTSILERTFYQNTALICVDFGKNSRLVEIGEEAFYGCVALTDINLPDSITSIGDWAFADCTSLTSIAIPDSVTSIGYGVFSDCTGLTSVVIGDSVTSIGKWAFADCTNLKDVYYTGTEAEWAEISIGSYNTNLKNATIHYNYVPAN
ncbi:MAG: leucine-rich repeat protein [Clostridia bacterium]|nr:leucine-rich repeat protein [Clostridia bacterium]